MRRRKQVPDRYGYRFFGRAVAKLARDRADEEGWTQGDVARHMGITEQALSRWILGHSLPTGEDWEKLSKITPHVEDLREMMERDLVDYARRMTGIDPEAHVDHARAILAYSRKVATDKLALREEV